MQIKRLKDKVQKKNSSNTVTVHVNSMKINTVINYREKAKVLSNGVFC